MEELLRRLFHLFPHFFHLFLPLGKCRLFCHIRRELYGQWFTLSPTRYAQVHAKRNHIHCIHCLVRQESKMKHKPLCRDASFACTHKKHRVNLDGTS